MHPNRCIEEVPEEGMSVRFRRCYRKATKGAYCHQHHPDTIAQRKIESQAKWDAKRVRDPLYQAMALIEEQKKEIEALRSQIDVMETELQQARGFE